MLSSQSKTRDELNPTSRGFCFVCLVDRKTYMVPTWVHSDLLENLKFRLSVRFYWPAQHGSNVRPTALEEGSAEPSLAFNS
ncbi:MAG: hypothetical protein EBU82_09645 [Flavobacteriia bacterium]|nr:hypothetical protein [Flavobacteriia bacterium]